MRNRLLFFGALVACLAAVSASALIVICPSSSNGDDLFKRPKLPFSRPSLGGMTTDLHMQGDIELAFSPSSKTGEARAYRGIPPTLDADYAAAMAQKFGVAGTPEYSLYPTLYKDMSDILNRDAPRQPHPCYRVTSDAGTVEVLTEGIAIYEHKKTEQAPTSRQLGEDQARGAAERYLSERGLLPGEAEIWLVTPPLSDGVIFVEFWHRDIRITRSMPFFEELGNSITVGIEQTGDIADVSYYWPELVKLADYPLISERQAYQSIVDAFPTVETSSVTMTFASSELVYRSALDEQGNLLFLPVYCFKEADSGQYCAAEVPAVQPRYYVGGETPTPPPTLMN
jgi:hypothetical protein